IVDRYHTDATDLTPGGLAQSTVAVPYYRDDSCFDDGTGTDPGPRIKPGSADEPRDGRTCWHPEDGQPDGSSRFFQGSIATHGVHLLFIAESDNARQTVPIDEIVSQQDMAMIPGEQPGAVGASYGQVFAQPAQAIAGRAVTVRDASAPSVHLAVRKRRHGRAVLRWTGRDTGGSGMSGYTVQVRAPHGRWRTLRVGTTGHSLRYRGRVAGRYGFRVRAVDKAGNRSRWSLRRATLN
ncbi:MAG: hypothetical protein QOJ09_2843, partial [Actinomycetota bacterium]|nr:hypothetical protein [Actinomycetota bacterium]